MTHRFEYALDLGRFDDSRPPPPVAGLSQRPARMADWDALAELMIDAYWGTIDYDGETLADAVVEIQAYLEGERGGQPLLEASRLAFAEDELAGACLAAEWTERRRPIIAYVMTAAAWKNRGVGKQTLWAVLRALKQAGAVEVRAVITEGNLPSERLLGGMGFRRATEG